MRLSKGARDPLVIDEFEGEMLGPIPDYATLKSKRVDVDELPVRPPAHVVEIRETETVLSSLWRRRVGHTIEVLTFLIENADLPSNIKEGAVLVPSSNGIYKLTDLSILEYRRLDNLEKFEGGIGKDAS
jgi:hypothetical protein